MKKLLFTIAIGLVGMTAHAQETLGGVLPMVNGKIMYTGVVSVDSASKKDDLFQRTKLWFVENYTSANDVIQMEDKENGIIVGKGYFEEMWQVTFYASMKVKVYHTIKMYVKDGRYRYEITDFNVKYYVAPGPYNTGNTWVDQPLEVWNKTRVENMAKFYPKVDAEVQKTILSINNKLKLPTIAQNNNW